MRPQLLKLSRDPGHSFSVRQDHVTDVNNRWHLHPEVELIHFKNGKGMQFVGDNMRPFQAGDLVLVGPDLPHYWRFGDDSGADVRVVHFGEHFWGKGFLELPETVHIKALLQNAKRGLQVEGEARLKVAAIVEKLLQAEGMHRLLLLQEALYTLSLSDELKPLSSIGFRHQFQESEYERINAIYEYGLQHFKRAIQLEEIAGVANISPNSFCRFFKSRTHKTFSKFLIEIRVGHACKLLIENNFSIKQICYDSGFNNFTSFYKYFKLITGKSPLGYQREYIAVLPGAETRDDRKRKKWRA